jgi:hypothetical protein
VPPSEHGGSAPHLVVVRVRINRILAGLQRRFDPLFLRRPLRGRRRTPDVPSPCREVLYTFPGHCSNGKANSCKPPRLHSGNHLRAEVIDATGAVLSRHALMVARKYLE